MKSWHVKNIFICISLFIAISAAYYQVIDFDFGNHQGVAFSQRMNIQEGKEPVILQDFITRYFACDDF